MRKPKKSKNLYKIKIKIFKALNFRILLVNYKLKRNVLRCFLKMAKLLLVLLVNGSEFHKTGAAQCTGLKLTTVGNFKKTTVVLEEQTNFTLLEKCILALV